MNDYSITNCASVFKFLRTPVLAAAFAFLTCFAAQDTSAQGVAGYTFAPSSGTFSALASATVITSTDPQNDDGRYPAAPIGFTFKYDGTNYTQVYAVTNGWMSFVPTTNFQFNNSLDGTTNANRPFVAPLFDDITMESGTVSYLTAGTSPNRVFTMQWLNARWNYLAPTASISFQVKLYEGSNRVQFIYRQEAGAVVAGDASFGASIGLAGTGTGSGNFLSLNNSSAAPTASSTTDTKTITTRPATGQTYLFTPLGATATEISISGRVLTNGRGLANARVELTGTGGQPRTVMTNAFGNFTFTEVEAGATFVVNVSAKKYTFAPQVISVTDNVSDLTFTAQ